MLSSRQYEKLINFYKNAVAQKIEIAKECQYQNIEIMLATAVIPVIRMNVESLGYGFEIDSRYYKNKRFPWRSKIYETNSEKEVLCRIWRIKEC